MRSDRLLSVWGVMLYACLILAVHSAHAQTKSAAPEITVYESPT
jgi:hypothetical protein